MHYLLFCIKWRSRDFIFSANGWSKVSSLCEKNSHAYAANRVLQAPLKRIDSDHYLYIIRNKFEKDEFLAWFWMIR